MSNWLALSAAISSAVVRFGSFVFLRWIPGHHFPPVIVTCSGLYLSSALLLLREEEVEEDVDTDTGPNPRGTEKTAPWKSVCKHLFTGIPSKKHVLVTTLSIMFNLALTAFAIDFIYRGRALYPTNDLAFSRIGYVSPTTANLLVREPRASNFPIIIKYRESALLNTSKWIEEGRIYHLNNETDFTFPVTLKNLKPATQYYYTLSNNQTGTFATAPLSGTQSANRLSFLTSSCIKPNFPYNPFSHPLRIAGLEQISHAIKKLSLLSRPSFMLFLGDFIYIDVPLQHGSSLEEYRSEYRRVYSSPSWHEPHDEAPIDLPWIHTLDDHEILNDWDKGNMTHPYPEAVDPYRLYHVSVNPPIPAMPYATPENTTYFSFINGPASIFMLDTRTYRTTPNFQNSTILGYAQLSSLLTYISRPEPAEVKWKIIASSVPFTKNWHVGTQDTWAGFLRERQTVFEAMWRAERELGVRIVLLSGDRHEFAATRFPDPDHEAGSSEIVSEDPSDGHGIHEFSVGPLNMFYLPIPSYYQTDSEDIKIKYAPSGNVKFGHIDINLFDRTDIVSDIGDGVRGSGSNIKDLHSVLTYTLHSDGEVVWKYQLSIPLRSMELEVGSQTRLPPGKVVFDKSHWVEEKAGIMWDYVNRRLAPLLSW